MKSAIALLGAVAVGAASSSLTKADLARAHLPKPLPSSHVVGSDPSKIFEAMNNHLNAQPYHTSACENYSHEQLNELARTLWTFRSSELAKIYDTAKDNRKFHFEADDGLTYKEKLWAEEHLMAATEPVKYGKDTAHYNFVRDGKCAELVMWWIHHLPAEARTKLSGVPGFKVPLLPAHGVQMDRVGEGKHVDEFIYQVSCSSCHSTGLKEDDTLTPVPRSKEAVNAVPPGTCPVDPKTGLPTVWYEEMSDVGNRRKRCDWDYDPPCGLCEGIGGYSWGEQQGDITYTDCEPVALAKDIPKDNITTPVWPKAFVVHEVTTLINQEDEGGQFPGADPCALHNYNNDTEVFYFDDSRVNYPGPIMYTNTTKADIYTLPSADMFIKIANTFCICVTPFENGNASAVPTGPLYSDFAKDAVLIGREIIGLEGLNRKVLADHWTKGPHHFWISVATNLFVRGWQPWNGLNVYNPDTWKIGPIAKEMFAVPKSCYTGLLHKNISCVAPYP